MTWDVLRVAAYERRRLLDDYKISNNNQSLELAKMWEEFILIFGGSINPPTTSSKEDLARICRRIFGPKWHAPAAKALGYSRNMVYCYASGRRRITASVARQMWEWDQLMDEAAAGLVAEMEVNHA